MIENQLKTFPDNEYIINRNDIEYNSNKIKSHINMSKNNKENINKIMKTNNNLYKTNKTKKQKKRVFIS